MTQKGTIRNGLINQGWTSKFRRDLLDLAPGWGKQVRAEKTCQEMLAEGFEASAFSNLTCLKAS